MTAYIARRLLSMLPVMAVVALFVFLLLHLAPGDPAAIIAGDNASPENIAQIRKKLGLDEPVWKQFLVWVTSLSQGDLGRSMFWNDPVTTLIRQRAEPTISLACTTIAVAVTVAITLGVTAAAKAGTLVDRLVMGFAVMGFSVPVFVVGYMLIFLFAIQLKWLPVQGYTPFAEGVLPWLRNLALPSIALGMAYVALIARITRATMLDVLAEDYMRTARAKGVAPRPMLLKHAQERGRAHRHGDRHRRCAFDRRRGHHRDGVQHPRHRTIGGGRHRPARLPDHPGRHHRVLGHLRAGEPAGGPVLHPAGPQDPLLRWPP